MAKSLRSKWKRKCRAVKRERYGKKELERLKKTLGIDDAQSGDGEPLKELTEVVTFTTADKIKEKNNDQKEDIMGGMEVEELNNKFDPKTLRNEKGAYPVWLHPRKIKKTSKKSKKIKTKGKITKKNKK